MGNRKGQCHVTEIEIDSQQYRSPNTCSKSNQSKHIHNSESQWIQSADIEHTHKPESQSSDDA